jgi:hypothetical protein
MEKLSRCLLIYYIITIYMLFYYISITMLFTINSVV